MTREIEARLKLSATDQTGPGLNSAARRLAEFERKAKAVDRAVTGMARADAVERKAAAINAATGRVGALAAATNGAALRGLAVVGGALSAKEIYKQYADYDRVLTRILITAEASADESARTREAIRSLAQETALPIEQVTAGLDSLVAAGRTLPDALAFLPAVSRTAQAAGADVIDIAKSADALGTALKIPADQMNEAFDKMAKAGKLGKFELKDMARYLPSLLPLASSKGFKGMEGLEQVVSYLQMIRQGTGTADEAADSFRDMLGKLNMDETKKKFKKFGIDVGAELKKVREKGGNEFDRMIELTQTAMKKGAQITDLFADVQAYRGFLAYINALGDKAKYLGDVSNATGTVTADLARVTRSAAAASQRLGNAWSGTLRALGNVGDAVGVTTLLDKIARTSDEGASNIARLADAMRELGVVAGVKKWLSDNEAAPGTSAHDAKMTREGLGDFVQREQAKKLLSGGGLAQAEEELRRAEARAGNDPYGPRGRPTSRVALAQKHLSDVKSAERYLYPFADYGAVPGLPADEAARLGRSGLPQPRPALPGEVGGITPMPRPRPDPYEIPVQLDDASLDSEVQRLRARLQSNLDANPLVLRARVDASGAGGLNPGRSFSGGNFTGAP